MMIIMRSMMFVFDFLWRGVRSGWGTDRLCGSLGRDAGPTVMS